MVASLVSGDRADAENLREIVALARRLRRLWYDGSRERDLQFGLNRLGAKWATFRALRHNRSTAERYADGVESIFREADGPNAGEILKPVL
jgi:hypothetical protein